MEIIAQVGSILSYGEICDHCLGRFFGKRSHGLTNRERGRGARIAHALENHLPLAEQKEPCWICGNLFDHLDEWAARAVQAAEGIEYQTFLVGSRVPPMISESEEMVISDLSLTGAELIKSEINRETGKLITTLSGRQVDFKNPDLVFLLDIPGTSVEVQVSPLFFSGRYQKLERGIPQTHWDCRSCRGAGCEKCNFTGKQYQDSVEELIGRPAKRLFEAENAVLHGAGREDIDARMIGTGRPFVMEMVHPCIRNVDLRTLEKEINDFSDGRVSVQLECFTGRSLVETLKSNKAHKKYRILVEIAGSVPTSELNNALDRLKGATIQQRTPQRVAHRRADKIRERRVLDIECVGISGNDLEIEVLGEAGLYIKELVSGDDGRTSPSLAEILGRPARVKELDVVMVEGTEKTEG
jgi:tRNA pseudouridine synthase 10